MYIDSGSIVQCLYGDDSDDTFINLNLLKLHIFIDFIGLL